MEIPMWVCSVCLSGGLINGIIKANLKGVVFGIEMDEIHI